jgi:hypothetical protein
LGFSSFLNNYSPNQPNPDESVFNFQLKYSTSFALCPMLYALLRLHISTGKSTACSAAISSDGLKGFKGAGFDLADGSFGSVSGPDSGSDTGAFAPVSP